MEEEGEEGQYTQYTIIRFQKSDLSVLSRVWVWVWVWVWGLGFGFRPMVSPYSKTAVGDHYLQPPYLFEM